MDQANEPERVTTQPETAETEAATTESPETGVEAAAEPHDPAVDDAVAEQVIRRIRRTSLVAYFVFCPVAIYLDSWRGFLGLTCSAAVVMINFLWLEEIVTAVLQPGPHLHAWRLTLRALARFALLGVAILVTILVARFNAVSVLLGFSIVVVGIFGEAVYSLRRSLVR